MGSSMIDGKPLTYTVKDSVPFITCKEFIVLSGNSSTYKAYGWTRINKRLAELGGSLDDYFIKVKNSTNHVLERKYMSVKACLHLLNGKYGKKELHKRISAKLELLQNSCELSLQKT